jgi:hypothetical protein
MSALSRATLCALLCVSHDASCVSVSEKLFLVSLSRLDKSNLLAFALFSRMLQRMTASASQNFFFCLL